MDDSDSSSYLARCLKALEIQSSDYGESHIWHFQFRHWQCLEGSRETGFETLFIFVSQTEHK